jgi:hypothetical protein
LELHTLLELGVAGISLSYAEAREVDQHGNSFRYKAAVYGTPGSSVGMTAWDVWLVGTKPEPVFGGKAALSSPEPMATGNPKELKRCYKAADGTQYDWLDYCNTVPWRLYGSCKNIASDRDFGRRGIAAALNVKTTTMTRSEQKTD